MTRKGLGEFEQRVLLAILQCGGEAYSVPLVVELEERSGQEVSQAAVFVALRRMEDKGLVSSRMEEGEDTASGRARRHFRVRPEGLRLLKEVRETMARFWEGLDGVVEEGLR